MLLHQYLSISYTVYLQITTPSFPVVVKIGHAHSGMGKVIGLFIYQLTYIQLD